MPSQPKSESPGRRLGKALSAKRTLNGLDQLCRELNVKFNKAPLEKRLQAEAARLFSAMDDPGELAQALQFPSEMVHALSQAEVVQVAPKGTNQQGTPIPAIHQNQEPKQTAETSETMGTVKGNAGIQAAFRAYEQAQNEQPQQQQPQNEQPQQQQPQTPAKKTLKSLATKGERK